MFGRKFNFRYISENKTQKQKEKINGSNNIWSIRTKCFHLKQNAKQTNNNNNNNIKKKKKNKKQKKKKQKKNKKKRLSE